jgi:hypothetical protein
MDTEPERTPVAEMLHHVQQEIFPEGAMCTAWVLSTEWMNVDGEWFTFTLTDQSAPVWRHLGLLTKSTMELDAEMADDTPDVD